MQLIISVTAKKFKQLKLIAWDELVYFMYSQKSYKIFRTVSHNNQV